jgi:hypothetical protein
LSTHPMRQLAKTGLLLTPLLLGGSVGVEAQAAARPFPTWQPAPLLPGALESHPGADQVARLVLQDSTERRSHTGTGLLVGGIVGVAATTVFLIGFCDDPDTQCGIDEVGRALLIIALPAAALGALIGSLIHSED